MNVHLKIKGLRKHHKNKVNNHDSWYNVFPESVYGDQVTHPVAAYVPYLVNGLQCTITNGPVFSLKSK